MVIIVEGLYHDRLLDRSWDASRITRNRRVLRVAITRARHNVLFIRLWDAVAPPCTKWLTDADSDRYLRKPPGYQARLARRLSCTLPAEGMPVPMSRNCRMPASSARKPHCPLQECPIGKRDGTHLREGAKDLPDGFPVDRIVILASEVSVIHPRRMRLTDGA